MDTGLHSPTAATAHSTPDGVPFLQTTTIVQSALLHLAPGVLIALVYGLLASFFRPAGLPSLMAIAAAVPLALLPAELGFLLWQGRQLNGRFSLKGVVQYHHKTPLPLAAGLILAGVIWAVLMSMVFASLDHTLMTTLFGWLPPSYIVVESMDAYPKGILIANALLQIIVVGIAAPWIEELYFRGYLLPRIAWMKNWAPLFGALFFSLYHFWSPWNILSRFLAVLPMVAIVYWKKDLRLGIWTHCLLNSLSALTLLISAFQIS